MISKEFHPNCKAPEIVLKMVPIESPSFMGIREEYHGPLRRIFKKLYEEQPRSYKDNILGLSVKAMNDTLGSEGLVPSLLVF